MDRVIESFSKQRLGIGLKKFTKRSILNIISVFQSLEDPGIDHASLGMFVNFDIYHPGLRGEEPKVIFWKGPPSFSKILCKWGEKFGMHVSHRSSLQMKSKERWKRIHGKWDLFATFHFHTRLNEDGSNDLILSNFRCAFDVPYMTEIDEIYLPNHHSSSARAQTNNKRHKPNLDAIAHVFSSKIAADMAREAAKRLSRLLEMQRNSDGDEGISLEHISINSEKAAICCSTSPQLM